MTPAAGESRVGGGADEGSKAGEAVGGDEAGGDELGQRFLGAEVAGEGGAACAEEVEGRAARLRR